MNNFFISPDDSNFYNQSTNKDKRKIDFDFIFSLFTKVNNNENEIIQNVEPEIKLNPFKEYKKEVLRLTKLQPLETLDNYKKKGFELDHKISIYFGFKNDIDASLISCIDNLKYIPKEENLFKYSYCVIDELNEYIIKNIDIKEEYKHLILEKDYDKTLNRSRFKFNL
jgi:hypothetical protein